MITIKCSALNVSWVMPNPPFLLDYKNGGRSNDGKVVRSKCDGAFKLIKKLTTKSGKMP